MMKKFSSRTDYFLNLHSNRDSEFSESIGFINISDKYFLYAITQRQRWCRFNSAANTNYSPLNVALNNLNRTIIKNHLAEYKGYITRRK